MDDNPAKHPMTRVSVAPKATVNVFREIVMIIDLQGSIPEQHEIVRLEDTRRQA